MAGIRLDAIEKQYAGGKGGVRDVNLEIRDGELVVLVGPSGSGKSTTLRLIAGLESPTRGRVHIGTRDVTDLPPQARDLAMVFQSYALYPHKTVRENLAFGLRMHRVPRAEIDDRVRHAADVLQIAPLLDRRPAQLSGGERQRVALGRAIVRRPHAFLFDEPLSNLDPALRLETRAELALLHRRLGATMVYVTHDQEEAMTLGDRIVVMRDGRIQQAGAPDEVYGRPVNTFVARFVGAPPMNLLRRGDGLPRTEGPWLPASAGREAIAGIRPHEVAIVGPDEGDARATVAVVERLGRELHVHLDLEGERGERVIAVTRAEQKIAPDDRVGLRFPPDRLHWFDATTGSRLS